MNGRRVIWPRQSAFFVGQPIVTKSPGATKRNLLISPRPLLLKAACNRSCNAPRTPSSPSSSSSYSSLPTTNLILYRWNFNSIEADLSILEKRWKKLKIYIFRLFKKFARFFSLLEEETRRFVNIERCENEILRVDDWK